MEANNSRNTISMETKQQQTGDQPGDAIHRIIYNLRNGGGSSGGSSSNFFSDDRYSTSSPRTQTDHPPHRQRVKTIERWIPGHGNFTQYIRPPKLPTRPSGQATNNNGDIKEQETRKLKKLYLEKQVTWFSSYSYVNAHCPALREGTNSSCPCETMSHATQRQ